MHLKAVSEAIPLDTLASFIIDLANRLQRDKLQNIRDIFFAADLNGSRTLDLTEFKVLAKLFNNKQKNIKRLFMTFSQNLPEMDCDQFERMCIAHELFTSRS